MRNSRIINFRYGAACHCAPWSLINERGVVDKYAVFWWFVLWIVIKNVFLQAKTTRFSLYLCQIIIWISRIKASCLRSIRKTLFRAGSWPYEGNRSSWMQILLNFIRSKLSLSIRLSSETKLVSHSVIVSNWQETKSCNLSQIVIGSKASNTHHISHTPLPNRESHNFLLYCVQILQLK